MTNPCRLVRGAVPMLSELHDNDLHSCLHHSKVCRFPSQRSGVGSSSSEGRVVEEKSKEGLGFHVLVLGGVDVVTHDALTLQVVLLSKLREVGDVLGSVSTQSWSYSAHAGVVCCVYIVSH